MAMRDRTLLCAMASERNFRARLMGGLRRASEFASRLRVAADGAGPRSIPAKKSADLDDPLLPQPFTRLRVDSKFIENLVGVRAQGGSTGADPGRRAREFRGWSRDRRDCPVSLRDILHHVQGEHM